MLALDILWLAGTAFLARDPTDDAPDWPPQPDRVFSALVASWGAGGEEAGERAALGWLEQQAPPGLIVRSPAGPRQTVTFYVPPNELKHRASLSHDGSRLRRQPRRFPAVALDPEAETHLTLVWEADAPDQHRCALDRLARRTSSLGHSASLVRMRFHSLAELPAGAAPAQRAPHPGRLAELEALHRRHLAGDDRARPRPALRPGRAAARPGPEPPFAGTDAWIVLEHAGGDRPDLRAAAAIAGAMRQALMQGWTRAHAEPAPTWISGHEPEGAPARAAHLAIVPLANIGWEFADGRLMGLALVPPATVADAWNAAGPAAFADRERFRRALAALWQDADQPVLALAPPGGGAWIWRLALRTGEAASLDPGRYGGPARLWASATPVLLDRHLKGEGPPERAPEAEAQLRAALERAGLPPPRHVRLDKHTALRGVPPARPAGGNPRWSGWARRPAFESRPLLHVRLAFDEPVTGPILIGAGRFHGLGLFLPLDGGGR